MTHEAGDPRGNSGFRRQQAALMRQWAAERRPCFCRQPIDYSLSGNDTHGPTLDHIRALSTSDDSAAWDPRNFRPAHRSCNLSKGNRAAELLYDLGEPSQDW